MTLDKSTSCHISAWALDLLPFPLCFIISLLFGLHIHVHVDAEKWQLKMGRPWIVHHMNDIRYVWDGHSGSGAHIQLIKWWNTQNAYIHLVSTWCLSHDEWSQGFPISCHFLIVITEKNKKQTDKEKAGRLRNKTTFSSAGSPSILRRCFQTVCDSCLDIGYVAILYV